MWLLNAFLEEKNKSTINKIDNIKMEKYYKM